MGLELVHRMNAGLEKMDWPGEPRATALGSQTFEMGLDIVDDFNGDLQTLNRALKTFRSGDSRPYALAGVAYMLLAGAVEKDGGYAPTSLDLVLAWLEKAQADEPDRPDINFIEAQVYICAGQIDNARLVLDYLMSQAPYYYRLNVTEALYAEALGDLDRMASWYGGAAKYADNVPKQVRLYEKMGDAYAGAGRFAEAIEQYKYAIHFNNQSGRLWHKLSYVYWELEEIEECKMANGQAMRLGYGAEAEEMRNAIRRRLGTTAFLRRMLGAN